MRRVMSAFLVAALAAIAAVPTAAADDPVRNLTFKGTSGVAFWSTCPWLYDSSYPAQDVAVCTNTNLFVTEDAYREDGTKHEGSHVIFTQVEYAYLDGNLVPVRLREGYGPAQEWSVERDLEGGVLRVVVPVRDCFYRNVDICTSDQLGIETTVETTWEAAGPLIRTTGAGAFRVGDSLTVHHSNSLRRETTASGVVDGAETGTHLFSLLFSTSGGSLFMCRAEFCAESQ